MSAFGRVASLAEDPVVDGQRDIAEVRQHLRVGRWLQVAPAVDEFLLADLVAAAVGVVEEHGRRAAGDLAWSRQVRRNGFDAVEVELPRFEDVPVTLGFAQLASADGPVTVGQVAHQRVELGTAVGRCCRRLTRRQLRGSRRGEQRGYPRQSQHVTAPQRDVGHDADDTPGAATGSSRCEKNVRRTSAVGLTRRCKDA